MSNRTPQNWAEQFDERVRRTPLIVLLFLAAVLISSIVTISNCANDVWDDYLTPTDWRSGEYAKLSQLRAGTSVAKMEELLGAALFVRVTEDGNWRESTFDGRDYWVQAVSDRDGKVVLLSITTCDAEFTPTLETPVGRITLGRTRLNEVKDSPSRVRYSLAAATANSFFIDQYYGGNPGLYKTYFVALNDSCPMLFDRTLAADHFLLGEYVDREFDPQDVVISSFRDGATANTYAETEPFGEFTSLDQVLSEFQVGADRILTRTAPP